MCLCICLSVWSEAAGSSAAAAQGETGMGDECTAMFGALADATRLRILELLKERSELCVSDIAENFDMKQPSISHHLDVLKRAGLVASDKRGREVYYRVNPEAIIQCCGDQLRLLDLELRVSKDGRSAKFMRDGKPVISVEDE